MGRSLTSSLDIFKNHAQFLVKNTKNDCPTYLPPHSSKATKRTEFIVLGDYCIEHAPLSSFYKFMFLMNPIHEQHLRQLAEFVQIQQ